MWRYTLSNFSMWFAGVVLVAVLAHPGVATACSTCFSANEAGRLAYYGTTVGLSLLPLALVVGLGYWIYRVYFKAKS